MVNFETIIHLWPEVVLVLLAAWIYVGGAFQQSRLWWSLFSLAAYGVAALVIWRSELPLLDRPDLANHTIASGPIVVDHLGAVLRLLAIAVGALFTLTAMRTVREELASEFFGTLMCLVVGVMLVARANDLVLLFVGLELISIPTYVLLYLGRRDRATSEATAKYFFLSIFSSAILLYGTSFLYGVAGSTTLVSPRGQASIAAALATGDPTPLASIALVLIAAGLGFKIAAVPFHFYAPDVYQGATNGNAGLLAIAPKIAGVAALIRVLVVAMPNVSTLAWQVLLVMAIASMTLGNVCALWQNNLRRLMAFSSIAHAGYLLIGIVVALGAPRGIESGGIGAATLYVIAYSLASAGTFAALAYLGGVIREVNGVDELAGLGRSQPAAAAVLAICLFSLAGIPPLAGFWGKLTLFFGAIHVANVSTVESGSSVWFVLLAVAGALNAAIAAAYYLRVVSIMYFGSAKREFGCEGGWGARTAMLAAAIAVVAIGVFPSLATNATQRAERGVKNPVADHASPPTSPIAITQR